MNQNQIVMYQTIPTPNWIHCYFVFFVFFWLTVINFVLQFVNQHCGKWNILGILWFCSCIATRRSRKLSYHLLVYAVKSFPLRESSVFCFLLSAAYIWTKHEPREFLQRILNSLQIITNLIGIKQKAKAKPTNTPVRARKKTKTSALQHPSFQEKNNRNHSSTQKREYTEEINFLPCIIYSRFTLADPLYEIKRIISKL